MFADNIHFSTNFPSSSSNSATIDELQHQLSSLLNLYALHNEHQSLINLTKLAAANLQTSSEKLSSKQDNRIRNVFVQPPLNCGTATYSQVSKSSEYSSQVETKINKDTVKLEEPINLSTSQNFSKLYNITNIQSKPKIIPVFKVHHDYKRNPLKRLGSLTDSDEDSDIIIKKIHTETLDSSNVVKSPPKSAGRPQNKWKNIPGHIMSYIRRACKSYIGEGKEIKLKCVDNVLKNQTEEFKVRFHDFIHSYKSGWKTYSTIRSYMKSVGDQALNTVLLEIIDGFLAEDNVDDFELWLSKARMNSKTKECSVIARANLRKEFANRLSF